MIFDYLWAAYFDAGNLPMLFLFEIILRGAIFFQLLEEPLLEFL